MKVACLQLDVRAGDAQHNLARVADGLRSAADAGVRLVCLPEMWPTSFPPGAPVAPEQVAADERALARLAELSAELDLVVCGTALAAGADGGAPTNRLHVLDRGRAVLAYDKVHLFTPTAEPDAFAPGEDAPSTVDTSVGRLAGVVCYDLRFPEATRPTFVDGAEVLLCPAQWPAPRAAHWRALVPARAVEGQCHVVACNRTGTERVGRRRLELDFPGNSLVASPSGEVLAEGRGEEGLVVATLDLELGRRLRVRVPVAKDRRPELYARWEDQRRG